MLVTLDAEVKATLDRLTDAIKGVTGRLLEPILRLWETDPHSFSKRPCATCSAISALADRPFGCDKKRQEP